MFKNLCFNKLKKIQFYASFAVLFAIIVDWLLPAFVPEFVSEIILTVAVAGLAISTALYFMVVNFKKKFTKYVEDELSRKHENQAAQITLMLVMFALAVSLVVALFIEFSVSINSTIVMSVFFALYAFNNGCYLYLERSDAKNAELDNED